MENVATMGSLNSRNAPRSIAPIAWLIVIYWIGQFSVLTAQRLVYSGGKESLLFLGPRAFMALVGVSLSFAIAAWQRRQSSSSWTRRLTFAFLAAFLAAPVHGLINFAAFQVVMPKENMAGATLDTVLMATVQWFWTYAAISALLLTASYSDALLERERRLADLQGLAHSAQMRSLRYQLNPHFMFNTLNSVAALIAGGWPEQAERMVENLADFLRASLAVDPTDDLTLEREFELQSLYLSIESARFADRLTVETILPPELRDVLVPSLILQPIIENAIKHGVARNAESSTLRIEASRDGDRMQLTVSNAVPKAALPVRIGTSVGLANVARRIELRYAGQASFEAGPEADCFVVKIKVPIHRGE
ncbi:MAG: yehU 2 [Alphaproteobacteria bacterium]|nr:yehU 2 [Alphaproteobacteria bacterium]